MFTLRKHRTPTGITNLSDDTLLEIISRLSVKHMVSCKCVSKLWHSLISTVCIPKLLSSPMHSILFNSCSGPTPVIPGPWYFVSLDSPNNLITSTTPSIEHSLATILPFVPTRKTFLNCCDGFLLFFDPSSMQYYICNPSMEQCVSVPNSPQNDIPFSAALVFDPHYKVVQIRRYPALAMNIYSSENRVWILHSLDIEPSIDEGDFIVRHVYLDGSLYRLTLNGYLLKFDIREIGVQAVELPNIVTRDTPIGCLGVSQGRLHYAWDDDKSYMMVWMLGENAHTFEWVLKHTICHQYFREHPLCSKLHDRSNFSVYAFYPNSDVLVVGNSTGFYQYDPNTKALERICRLESGIFICSGQYDVYPFSHNLTTIDFFGPNINNNQPGS